MNILVILAHPDLNTFNHAIASVVVSSEEERNKWLEEVALTVESSFP